MNAERLLAHYAEIADAPDAIGRLRRFILDLAVRGKLLLQDPGDEPASELLKRIAAEKANLVSLGAAKAEKSLLAPDDAAEFEVPASWRWTRLGFVTSYIQRGKSPKYADANGAPVISQKCVQWAGLDLSVAKQITLGSLPDYEPIRLLRHGDLLWNSTGTGTIGRVIRLTSPPVGLVCDSHVTVVRCLEVVPEYIRTWLRSDHVYALIEGRAAGSTNQVELTAQMAINQALPLPPLAEQHRIVAKVDELMALCDQLEAARAEREAARDRLAAASLARLNTPDPNTFADDAHFALDALPALTTRPDQIKQLRQTILNLSVRGKLVPQDLGDEPASEFLNKLQRRARKARQKIGSPSDGRNEASFNCPEGWAWTTVQEILDPTREISYGVIKLGDEPKTGGIPTLRCSDVRPGFVNLSGVRKVREDIEAEYARTRLAGGEVLVNIRGTLGGVALVSDDLRGFNVAREVAVVPVFEEISGKFIVYLMLSQYFWDHIQSNLRGIAYKGLNLGILRDLPIPLPPLAEQHRIVAKVDELMALCDQLEASLDATATTRRRLLDALLAEALAPATRELEVA